MKFFGVILILGGVSGVMGNKPILGVFLIVIGVYLFKKPSKIGTPKVKESRITSKNLDLITVHKKTGNTGNEFIALDLETTGLSTEFDRIVEVAAIKFSNREKIETFYSLVNPNRTIPSKTTEINGITNAMVKDSPTIYEILIDLLDFIGNSPIVAHNVMFDIGFIKNTCKRHFQDDNFWLDNKLIDSVKLSREMFPYLENHKLVTVAKHLNLNIDNLHRATDDAMFSAEIYMESLKYQDNKKKEALDNLSGDKTKSMDIVRDILIKNNRPLDLFTFHETAIYFDLAYFSKFVRLKLNGHKQYLLCDYDADKVKELYGDIYDIEKSSKAEGDKCRLMISSVNDIKVMEPIILDSFDKSVLEYERYLEYKEKRQSGSYAIKIEV